MLLNQIGRENKFFYFLFFIFFIFIFIFIPFFPLLSFLFLILFLNIFAFSLPFLFRSILHLLGLFALIVISSSRSFYNELDMDLTTYIAANDYFKNSSFRDVFTEYFVFEPGWNIIYWSLGRLGFNISGINVGITNYIISCFLYYIWFETHGLKQFYFKYHGIVTSTSLLFISISFFAILQRQSLACIFILFALSNYNNLKKFLLYGLVATIFHSTSIIFLILYYFLMKYKIKYYYWFYICLFVVFIRFLFPYLIDFISSLDMFSLKADYYKNNIKFDFFSFRLFCFVLFCLFSLVFIRGSLLEKSVYKNIIIFSLFCYFLTIGINLLPERLNYINVYLIGFYLALIYIPRRVGVLILLNFLCVILFFVERTILNSSSDESFWYRYAEYSLYPFYYLN